MQEILNQHEVCKVYSPNWFDGRSTIVDDLLIFFFYDRELEQELVPEWRAKYLNYKVRCVAGCLRFLGILG